LPPVSWIAYQNDDLASTITSRNYVATSESSAKHPPPTPLVLWELAPRRSSLCELGFRNVGPLEDCVSKVGSAEVGTAQGCKPKINAAKISTTEIDTAKVGSGKVRWIALVLFGAPFIPSLYTLM
jgi:hypothetical protein